MKHLLCIIFVLAMAGASSAQKKMKDKPVTTTPGSVSGAIVFKEATGNALGKFTCSNFVVSASKLGGGWKRNARAMGEFSKRRCMFIVPSVPAGDSFVAVLNARMPACDQKTFNTTTSFPMTLKAGEGLAYNFEVMKISCVLLK